MQQTPVTDVLGRTFLLSGLCNVRVFLLRNGQQVFISPPSQNLQENEEEAYAGVGEESKVIKEE
jgi:hypothetical protein